MTKNMACPCRPSTGTQVGCLLQRSEVIIIRGYLSGAVRQKCITCVTIARIMSFPFHWMLRTFLEPDGVWAARHVSQMMQVHASRRRDGARQCPHIAPSQDARPFMTKGNLAEWLAGRAVQPSQPATGWGNHVQTRMLHIQSHRCMTVRHATVG